MRLRRIPAPFDDRDYVFELKVDGFRAIVYVENGACQLVSRNLKLLKFQTLQAELAKLPVKGAILDGELICLDLDGVSRFNFLLERKWEPIFLFREKLNLMRREYFLDAPLGRCLYSRLR